MTKKPEVSFVIPVLNGAATLKRCLEAILAQQNAPDYEVIVVDNGSQDDSFEIIQKYPVTVLRESSQGRSQARNAGLARAQGDWVAFIDCDVVLHPNWLEQIYKSIALENFDGGQGKIIPGYDEASVFQRFRSKFLAQQTRGSFCHLNADIFFYPMINSAACFYRRSLLLEVSGFDPLFKTYEDADLSWRMWLKGARLRAVAAATCHVYWMHGGFIAYLRRNFVMGSGLSHLYKNWKIEIKNPTMISERLGIISSFFERVLVLGFQFGQRQNVSVDARFASQRLLPSLLPQKFILNNGEKILVLKPNVRIVWTIEAVILKDCLSKKKIILPNQTGAEYLKLLNESAAAIEDAGLGEVFTRQSA